MLLDGRAHGELHKLCAVVELFPNPEPWRRVSQLEFEDFLRTYPRPLQARPPLNQKARFREYNDPTLGEWPACTVAREFRIRRSAEYWLRER